jgi:translocation and assembly module TamA
VERARQDAARFQSALQGLGYYKGRVAITIGGKPLEDPTLPDAIERAPAQPPLQVVASVEPGPRFHIGKVTTEGSVPPSAQGAIGLAAGQDAVAADVLAARDRLLEAIRNAGYPLAKVTLLPATLFLDQDRMDVAFQVESGPVADLGPITLSGLQDMREDFVRRRLLIHPGERFSPMSLDEARRDLMSLGVFSVVRIVPAEQLDQRGALPIQIDLTERPLHAVELGAAYSTDLGINFNAAWRDRNLFGGAEQLNLTASTQLGGNALTKPGYQVGAQFIKPDFLARDQQLEVSINALKQSLEAYDQTALIERLALNRKLSEHWRGSIGILGEQERIAQEGITNTYNLIGLPISLTYDSTTSLLDPTEGIRATFSVTPMQSLSHQSSTFFIMQASGSTYIDLTNNGRSVIALRGLVGQISGAGVFALPPDQRFYAGGSGTVRGYRYQSIGPQFASGRPTGGTAVSAGTIELRQRILDNYGFVAFVDAGQVSASGAPFTEQWRVGAGIGARYYTPIGPIRLDFAMPLNKQPNGDRFELYIGIGQAF